MKKTDRVLQTEIEGSGGTERSTSYLTATGAPRTLVAKNNLASALKAHNRLEESGPLYREVLVARREALGNQHPDTKVTMSQWK